jgi:chromosome segregation ATPase
VGTIGAVSGDAISSRESKDADPDRCDFARLERAVAGLATKHERCIQRNRELVDQLEKRMLRIRSLEEELLAANQRRQDVAKRIDELIGQIDQLDLQMQSLDVAK